MSGDQGKDGRAAERWLFTEAASLRTLFIWNILAALLSALLLVVQSWLLADACHAIVIASVQVASLYPLVRWLFAIIVVRSLLAWIAEKTAASVAATLKQRLRKRVLKLLLDTPPAGRPGSTASLAETVIHGVDSLESYFTRFIPHLLLAAAVPPLIFVFVVPVEWRSTLVLLFSAPFIPLFMVLIGKGAERLNRNQWNRLSQMSGHLLDLIRGLPDIRICSAVKREAEAVARVSEQYRLSTMGVLRVAFLSAFTLEFFTTVGTAVIAVIIGFRLLGGSLELKHGLFILLLAPEFYLPLRTLGASYHSRMQGVAAAEKLLPLLNLPTASRVQSDLKPLPTAPFHLACRDLCFSYSGTRGELLDVTLELMPGTITAIIGASGSGKSTLAALLTGLARPLSGTVTVNGINIDELDQDQLRQKLAWVPQKPFFFNGSIRENLTIGLAAQSETAIFSALRAANAHDFVSQLPEGVDSNLGDRGAGLSGGELRRLALARAFLRSAAIIILDEPTAGLDSNNELLVCQAIKAFAKGRTILLISHREETVKWADRSYRLSGGRLSRGEHD
jgi:ATP-binding cassette subfamily C protein CydD